MADNETPQVDVTEATSAFREYALNGPNAEYKALEFKLGLGMRRSLTTYWQFVRDAVEGFGGFTNGLYLYPYQMEVENTKATPKLQSRRDQADYDNFARDIMDASWDQIVQSRDLITRRAPDDEDPLNDFWMDVDGRGLHIMDFLEYPFRQARMYGTGYVFMDRGQNIGAYASQSLSEGNAPWAYSIPSEYVVNWDFTDEGEIDYVTLIEPTGDQLWEYVGAKWAAPAFPHNVLTWTKTTWARFQAIPQFNNTGQVEALGYVFMDGGVNEVGVVPMIPIFNDVPAPKKMIGNTEMPDVCRLAQTVYNIDSEAREIERKCALFLAMPVKDAKDYADKKVETGLDNIMVYDGDAGKPEWVSPNLDILAKLADRRARMIDSAYKMGHLRAIVGAIKTQSGFHAEVEFAKTERRIARHASQLEQFEIKLAHLFQRFMKKEPGGVEITYPREYGVRDLERVLARAEIQFALQLGDKVNEKAAFDLLKSFYPRLSITELDALVKSAVKSLAQARIEAQQAALGGNVAGPSSSGAPVKAASSGANSQPGKGQPTNSQRIQKVLDRVNANLLGSNMKNAVDTEGA